MDSNTNLKQIFQLQWEIRQAEQRANRASTPNAYIRDVHTMQRKQEELRNLTKASLLGS